MKFHWKPKLGLQSVVWNEAVKLNGADPDFHRRDLWDAIQAGDFPEWELGLQLFDDEFADSFEFDVLDPTKIIPEEQVPVRRVGRLVLDRIVDNFFAETEQVAFCTQNVVPGIDFTNDPLLQGRNFSYLDTQLKRLGEPELHPPPDQRAEVPVPALPAGRAHGDRSTAVGRANYEPNSWPGEDGGPREDPTAGFTTFPAEEASATKRRLRPESFADHYSQARQFYVSQTRSSRSTSRRVRVRAEQGRDGPRSASAWSATCATSTRTSRPRSPTGSASSCPEANEPAQAAAHRPGRVARAQHPAQRPRRASRAARSACSSPTAPTPRCSVALEEALDEGGRAARARRARRSEGSPTSDGRGPRRGAEDRRRAVGALRRGRAPADGSRCGRAHADATAPRTSSPTRSRTASSSASASARSRCSTRSGSRPPPTTGSGSSAANGDAAGFVERCRDLRFWDRELQLVG